MITKICTKCNIEQPLSSFSINKALSDGLCTRCISCISIYDAKKYIARATALFEHKGGKCEHCNLRDLDNPSIYDYHHVNPATKFQSVTTMMGGSLVKLHAEADKCILLCANCHRIEHARLKKEPKAYEQEQPEQEQEQGQTIQYMLC